MKLHKLKLSLFITLAFYLQISFAQVNNAPTDENLESFQSTITNKEITFLKKLSKLFNKNDDLDNKSEDSNKISERELKRKIKKERREKKKKERLSKKLSKKYNINEDALKKLKGSELEGYSDFHEILVPKDKRQSRRLKSLFGRIGSDIKTKTASEYRKVMEDGEKEVKKVDVKYEMSLNNIQYTEFKFGVNLNLLDGKYIDHDTDKLYQGYSDKGIRNWNEFHFQTKLAFPFSFAINSNLPVSFSYGLRLGGEYHYRWRTPALSIYSRKKEGPWRDLFKSAVGKVTDIYQGIKSIRIPITAKGFQNQTKPGEEIISTGSGYIINSIGASLPLYKIVSIGSSAVLMTKANFSKAVKNVSVGDLPLYRITLKRNNSLSQSFSNSIRVGMTLFDFKIPIDSKYISETGLSGNLSLNILSHSMGAQEGKELELDYTYNFNYPEARKAFNLANVGDYLLTEKLASTSSHQKEYKGVTLNFRKNSLFEVFYNNVTFGFRANDTEFKSDILKYKLDEKLGNFLELSTNSKTVMRQEKAKSYIRELGEVKTFTYEKSDKIKIILGLLSDVRKKIVSKSNLITSEINTSQGIENIQTMITNYSYDLNQGRYGKRNFKKFLTLAGFAFGTNHDVLKTGIKKYIDDNPKCSQKVEIKLRARWFEGLVQTLSSMSEEDYWKSLSEFFGVSKTILSSKEKRRNTRLQLTKAMSEHIEFDKKYIKDSLYEQFRVFRFYIRKLEKKRFLERILNIGKANSKEEKLKEFNQLVKTFKADPFVFFYFAFLSDFYHDDDFRFNGHHSTISVKARGCQAMSWKMFKNSKLGLDSFLDEWNNQ